MRAAVGLSAVYFVAVACPATRIFPRALRPLSEWFVRPAE